MAESVEVARVKGGTASVAVVVILMFVEAVEAASSWMTCTLDADRTPVLLQYIRPA
jgi:hypothetical protein